MSELPRRNRLLSLEMHEKLADLMAIELIMTPWQVVEKVGQTSCVRDAKELMRADGNDFDQLGVEEGGRTGLIRYKSICGDDETAPIASKVEWAGESPVLQYGTNLIQSLEELASARSLLVQEVGATVGLVHLSDFNKQPVRSYFYLWLSALEIGLAALVRREIPDHDDWLPWLRGSSKVHVAGNLYLAQRENARLNATEYVELSDLVDVLTNSDKVGKELWKVLGYESKNKCSNELGSLVDLRHRIMHPVRTLVSDAASASEILDRNGLLKLKVNELIGWLGD